MPDDERVAEELEALQAILMDEITVCRDDKGTAVKVVTDIDPWTGLDPEQQYVRVTLEVGLPAGYPDTSPEVTLRNPRGLDDSLLAAIHQDVKAKVQANVGQAVIFEIIDLIKEKLTASNLPCCPCCICLYGFVEADQFVKTECYHYFHAHCLGGHVAASEAAFGEEQAKLPPWQQGAAFQAACPVCRAPIAVDIAQLQAAPPPQERETARPFSPTDELRSLQARMQALYLYQQSRGGIITHDNKYLLLNTESSAGPRDVSNR